MRPVNSDIAPRSRAAFLELSGTVGAAFTVAGLLLALFLVWQSLAFLAGIPMLQNLFAVVGFELHKLAVEFVSILHF